jgi:hypothetical protein
LFADEGDLSIYDLLALSKETTEDSEGSGGSSLQTAAEVEDGAEDLEDMEEADLGRDNRPLLGRVYQRLDMTQFFFFK